MLFLFTFVLPLQRRVERLTCKHPAQMAASPCNDQMQNRWKDILKGGRFKNIVRILRIGRPDVLSFFQIWALYQTNSISLGFNWMICFFKFKCLKHINFEDYNAGVYAYKMLMTLTWWKNFRIPSSAYKFAAEILSPLNVMRVMARFCSLRILRVTVLSDNPQIWLL